MCKRNIMIPAEIVNEILCRLPSKSVGRFRSVSKEWLSLLTQPAFIKTHQNTLKRNHLVFTSKDDRCLYSHPLNHHELMLTPTNLLIESDHDIEFHGSCNGLVLVVSDCYMKTLMVLNPTTRESVQLPESGYHYDDEWGTVHGIGYDSVTDDYKVITLTILRSGCTTGVALYSLKDNTWRRLLNCRYNVKYWQYGVYLDGYLNWLSGEGILTFSLADECFSLVPFVSEDDPDVTSYSGTRITVLGGKLAIYWKRNVFLMNEYGIEESWIDFRLDRFNETPMEDTRIFYDNGKIWIACINGSIRGVMLIYDFEKRTHSKNVIWDRKRFNLEDTYMESLVSPKFNYVNSKGKRTKIMKTKKSKRSKF